MTTHPIILCVDDDLDDRELLRGVLMEMLPLCQIKEAGNGREALDYLHGELAVNTPPSLIILDMNMPILDGRVTLSLLKGSTVTEMIPVIIFTTSNSPLDHAFCEKMGVELMTKPPTYDELRNAVKRQLTFAGLAT